MGTVRYTVVNGVVRSENRSGVERAYSLDPLGNTRALYDTTATRTDTFEYFPSGTVASRTGTTPTPFQWVGGSGYYRDNSKRVHVRARNFYVNLGRWAETDPIGFRGGDYNLYRYVKNRFVVMIDPSGLKCNIYPDLTGRSQPSKHLHVGGNPRNGWNIFAYIQYWYFAAITCTNGLENPSDAQNRWSVYQEIQIHRQHEEIDGQVSVDINNLRVFDTCPFTDGIDCVEAPYCSPQGGLYDCQGPFHAGFEVKRGQFAWGILMRDVPGMHGLYLSRPQRANIEWNYTFHTYASRMTFPTKPLLAPGQPDFNPPTTHMVEIITNFRFTITKEANQKPVASITAP